MSELPPGSDQSVRNLRLLRTKLLIPRAHADVVARLRLTKKLNEGLNRKLTLISAPAGFGKTTLLCEWISGRMKDEGGRMKSDLGRESLHPSSPVVFDGVLHPLRFGWLSLDERDNDPVRFWSYFVAALQTLQAGAGETVLAMLQSTQPPPAESILTELLNEVALLPQDFAIILDDYHAIRTQEIHSGLIFLLENMPAQMHLVIAGRSDPPLPLAQFRVKRELVELRADDLRFTLEEAAAFLTQILGLNLSTAAVEALDRLIEGWAAGLQLAALSMQGTQDIYSFIRSFSGSHRYVFDYLAQEVLNRQPDQVRSFLLRTSILERLSSELCDAVIGERGSASGTTQGKGTGENASPSPTPLSPYPLSPIPSSISQQMLERLEQANLFLVPLDQNRQWYRYHHLFSDFLQERLLQEFGGETVDDLHQRASQWYHEHGWITEAVDHALSAQDQDQARKLVSQYAPAMFDRSELTTLIRWLEALPESILRSDPYLSMVSAWALIATGRSDPVENHLQNIERILGVAADGSQESFSLPARVLGALGEISCLRASLAFNRMDIPNVVTFCRQAQAYLSQEEATGIFNKRIELRGVAAFNLALALEFSGQAPSAIEAFQEAVQLNEDNPYLWPMALSHLAQTQWVQGRLRSAEESYRQVLKTHEQNEKHTPMSGLAYTGLGNILIERNELDLATGYLTKGIELGRPWMLWEAMLTGYFGLARVKMARGEFGEASRLLQELSGLADKFQMTFVVPSILAQQALAAVQMGDEKAAVRWVQAMKLPPEGDIPYYQEGEAILLARVQIKLGEYEKAKALTTRLLIGVEAGQRCGRAIEILALQALALSAGGEIEPALDSLCRSLALAEPEGYIRIFLDEGQAMADLLLKVSRLNVDGAVKNYANRLLNEFEPQKTPSVNRQPPNLQPFELEPLRGSPERNEGPKPSSVSQRAALIEPLSERELEVLCLMAQGMTNQEIASELVISLNTVKTHVKNILNRLEVSNRTQATARAREIGLL